MLVVVVEPHLTPQPGAALDPPGIVHLAPGPSLEEELLTLSRSMPGMSWLVVTRHETAPRAASAVRVLRRSRLRHHVELAAVRSSPLRLHVLAQALARHVSSGRVPDSVVPVVLEELVARSRSLVLARSVLTATGCGARWVQRLSLPRANQPFLSTDGPGEPRTCRFSVGSAPPPWARAGGRRAAVVAARHPGVDLSRVCAALGVGADVSAAPPAVAWDAYWSHRVSAELVVAADTSSALVDDVLRGTPTWPCAWCSLPMLDLARCHACGATFEAGGTRGRRADVVLL